MTSATSLEEDESLLDGALVEVGVGVEVENPGGNPVYPAKEGPHAEDMNLSLAQYFLIAWPPFMFQVTHSCPLVLR